jgi:hypothetical protein
MLYLSRGGLNGARTMQVLAFLCARHAPRDADIAANASSGLHRRARDIVIPRQRRAGDQPSRSKQNARPTACGCPPPRPNCANAAHARRGEAQSVTPVTLAVVRATAVMHPAVMVHATAMVHTAVIMHAAAVVHPAVMMHSAAMMHGAAVVHATAVAVCSEH